MPSGTFAGTPAVSCSSICQPVPAVPLVGLPCPITCENAALLRFTQTAAVKSPVSVGQSRETGLAGPASPSGAVSKLAVCPPGCPGGDPPNATSHGLGP